MKLIDCDWFASDKFCIYFDNDKEKDWSEPFGGNLAFYINEGEKFLQFLRASRLEMLSREIREDEEIAQLNSGIYHIRMWRGHLGFFLSFTLSIKDFEGGWDICFDPDGLTYLIKYIVDAKK